MYRLIVYGFESQIDSWNIWDKYGMVTCQIFTFLRQKKGKKSRGKHSVNERKKLNGL